MSKRKPTRSGNPAAPAAPKLSLATGSLVLISDRAYEHEPDAAGHRWVILAMHQVDPSRGTFYLSEQTLVEAHRPKCAHCGAVYDPETAFRYCPGVEQPDAEPAAVSAGEQP